MNAHRVLRHTGRVAEAFNWADPNDMRDPAEMLRTEGVRFIDDRADPMQRLSAEDLAGLVISP